MRNKILITVFFLSMLHANNVLSQTSNNSKINYSKYPAWIDMMKDPKANYYEAVKAFNLYWKNKEKPIEEMEILNEDMSKHEKREHKRFEKKLSKMTPTQRQTFDELAYQFKRFKDWQRENAPYVQEDGSILSQEERNKIWNQIQDARKN